MAETHQCVKRVWSQYHDYPCGKNATLEHEGKWYCKTHHPPTVAAKDAARDAKWRAESAARDKKWKDEQRVAQSQPLLLAVLKEALCWVPDGSGQTAEQRGAKCSTLEEMFTQCNAALKVAEDSSLGKGEQVNHGS